MKHVLHKLEGISSIVNQSIENISSEESAILKVALQELQNKSISENWHIKESLKHKQDLISKMLDDLTFVKSYIREVEEAEEVSE